MDSNAAAPAALTTYEQAARMIEHPLLRPDLTTQEIVEGVELAIRYQVASVKVRPTDVDLVVRMTERTPVKAASVCGFPHGNSVTGTKLYEARDLLRRGVKEIDAVINYSKLRSREFQHVQTELLQLAEECRKAGAQLEVTLENAYLNYELKIIAVQCCERADVHRVKTSTGFAASGATMEDLATMRKYLPEDIGLTAEGGVATIDDLLAMQAAGCMRVETSATAAILDEWKARLTPPVQQS